jgi:hypothetical protein
VTARAAAALLALALAAPASADAERPFTIAIPGAGAPAGEVGFFDATGRRVGRLTGLGEPAHLVPAPGGRFLVLDRATGRILELDVDGRVTRDQACPPTNLHPDRAVLLADGHVLLTAEGRVTEIDAAGAVVAEFEPPPGVRFLGAARSPTAARSSRPPGSRSPSSGARRARRTSSGSRSATAGRPRSSPSASSPRRPPPPPSFSGTTISPA